MRRVLAIGVVFGILVAACAADSAEDTTTEPAPVTTSASPTTTEGQPEPPTSPAEVVFDAQESDGTSIVVASVTLPAAGFIAVHGNADGGPGPVIGHSDLLPAGTSQNVEITLDEPLDTTDLVFPMAHIDMNGNGVYEFTPPDSAIDGPASTADGGVAVVGAEVTVKATAAGAIVQVAPSALGDILVDAEGNTLYLFTPDNQGDSACYEQCAANWPPLTAAVEPGDGVDPGLLGSSPRTDGTIQATYNGWPLYYFAGDAAPGDTNGQGINDIWYVVSPAGDAVGQG